MKVQPHDGTSTGFDADPQLIALVDFIALFFLSNGIALDKRVAVASGVPKDGELRLAVADCDPAMRGMAIDFQRGRISHVRAARFTAERVACFAANEVYFPPSIGVGRW